MKARITDRAPKDVYLSFVSSLFGNRQTLFTGMVVHVLTYLAVYAKSGSVFYLQLTAVFALVCAFRIYWFIQFDQTDKQSLSYEGIAGWERIYLYGGVATTSILGIGSGYAIYMLQDPFAELVCIAVTMASMVSVVGRNFGSPTAVNLQTITASAPIMVGCLALGDFYMTLLSVTLLPFVLTTRKMANGVREFLYNNVIAAREISLIAESFDTALNNMTHGLIMLDTDNRIQVINRKACQLLHLGDRHRLKNCDLDVVLRYGVRHTFVDGSMPSLIQRQLKQLTDGSLSRAVMAFSEDLVLEFSASRRPEGGVVMIFEDVTARVRAERKVLHMVRFDSLTGLPQRNYFAELASAAMENREPTDTIGFMVLNVDGFKHVNDMKGHATGDRVLVAISKRLMEVTEGEIVGRLIGDQFVVFCAGEDGAKALVKRMRRLHKNLCGTYTIDDSTFHITFSAGCMAAQNGDVRMEEWQIKLDLALFESKARGGGVLTVFAEEMDARYVERQKLKDDLRDAVENRVLSVMYQPMYTPDGATIACCEALARWVHPVKGAIPPNIFIQIAEEMGIMRELTRSVVEQACRDCATWPQEIAVSVNLSVQDLRDDAIIGIIKTALVKSGLPASRLHLEVTESSLIEELVTVRAILDELRNWGITIAIDDFGTGFSSLSYLDTLPADVVKIDRSFVLNIGEDGRRMKLLQGIVNLSRQLDLTIIVEGVETAEQLALINEHKCADLIQGYVYSMPVDSDAIPELSQRPARRPAKIRGHRVA